jgi:hypothetical protein
VLARSAILPAVPIIFIMSRAPFAVHHRCKADPCPWEILRLGVFVIFIVAPAISAYALHRRLASLTKAKWAV